MSLASDKEPLLHRNVLITPSVSPPASRAASPKPRRKSTTRPPPNKRARTSETPSEPGPSGRQTPVDPPNAQPAVDPTRDEAWRASSQRLLNVWSQLAERYNVPLDQDDIIDLRTVKLVKDRGVTRSMKKGYQIGYFGDPSQDNVDASSEDERDGEDEIDSLPRPEPMVPIKLEMEKSNRVLPPFTEMNPADADDLKAFLEEEERRRAIGGTDDDPDLDEVEEQLVTDFEDVVDIGPDEEDENSDWVTERVMQTNSRKTPARRTPAPRCARTPAPSVHVGTLARALSPTDSEDEFAKADVDETTPVRPPRPQAAHARTPRPRTPPPQSHAKGRRPRTPSPLPHTPGPEIIDLTTPSPPSSPSIPLSRQRSLSRARSVRPPSPGATQTAYSSAVEERTDNAPIAAPSPSKSVARRFVSRNMQLQTPPLSSASGSTPEYGLDNDGGPGRHTSPPRRPLPRARPRVVEAGPSTPQGTKNSTRQDAIKPPVLAKSSQNRARNATPGPVTGRIPEVVLTRKPGLTRSSTMPSATSPVTSPNRRSKTTSTPSPPRARPDKGKSRASLLDIDISDDEPVPQVQPRRRRAKSLAPALIDSSSVKERRTNPVMSSPIRESNQYSVGGRVPATTGHSRKRKRPVTPAPSTSSEEEIDSPVKPPAARHAKDASEPPRTTRKSKSKVVQDGSEESEDEAPQPRSTRQQESTSETRSRSRAKTKPPPLAAPAFLPDPFTAPTHNKQRGKSRPPVGYPPPLPALQLQEPQAQHIAQAVHYLSYIIANNATGYALPYPVAYNQPQQAASPQTPKRHHRKARREPSSSPVAGPSSSPQATEYETPRHGHIYPFTFDPAYSSATSPPASSSPIPSPASSPVRYAPGRSKSRARSKSRTQRIAFRLDSDDRPPLRRETRPARVGDDEADADGERRQGGERKGGRGSGGSRARQGRVREEDASGDDDRPRRHERGRTPGPSSGRARSAAGRGIC